MIADRPRLGGTVLRRRGRRPRADAAIPTINVVFLLLLFFLVAGTLAAPEEADIDPAHVGTGAGERLPRPLLSIARDGSLGLNGKALSREALAGAVAALRRPEEGRGATLYVLPARDLPASTLVAILGEAAAAGAATTLVVMKTGQRDAGASP
ncbi:biopolymer transporter ExbD [Jiella sonneratiae]|uniref:Biopolymer transporter ExbD n=1 Tax=Jiella sonneratiae TaxID=2816856 RepID=A0ABS3J494_9HYPH|nr:biopolymer transporter ExbD [Jiella sonneratiae]MBO0904488.1 biopolymer transporter ExbD [Jiella sonneratiae]